MSQESHRATITCLVRLGQRKVLGRQCLATALARRLDTLLETALDVAGETEGPIGEVLAEILRDTNESRLLNRVMEWLSDQPFGDPTSLLEVAVGVNQRLFDQHLATWGALAGDQFALRELWLTRKLSARLRNLGRLEEALAIDQRAIARAQELALRDPPRFERAFALCLNALVRSLAALGRHGEAAQVASEAVAILSRSQPAEHQEPADLAISLQLLSAELAATGQSSEALEAISRAAELCRELTQEEASRGRLVRGNSLYLLSARLSDLGRWAEAVEAAREAVQVASDVAEAAALTALPWLAEHLNVLAKQLYLVGDVEGANQVAQEATEIVRKAAEWHPAAFRHRLAMKLSNQGAMMAEIGQPKASLALAREATQLYRELAGLNPAAYTPELVLCLQNLALRLEDMGSHREALETSTEALKLRLESHPDPSIERTDRLLADSLELHGLMRKNAGDLREGLRFLQQSVTLRRQLTLQQPRAAAPQLVQGLLNLAHVHIRLGELALAGELLDEAMESIAPFVASRERNSKTTFTKLVAARAIVLQELGQPREALLAQRQLHRLLRGLSRAQPLLYREQVARNHENLAISLGAVGRLRTAVRHLKHAMKIWRSLHAEAPEAYCMELSRAAHNLSYHQGLLGSRRAAVKAGREAVELLAQLAPGLPDVVEPLLVDSLHNLANQCFLAGRWCESVRISRSAQSLVRGLARRSPEAFAEAAARGTLFLKRRIAHVRSAMAEALRQNDHNPEAGAVFVVARQRAADRVVKTGRRPSRRLSRVRAER